MGNCSASQSREPSGNICNSKESKSKRERKDSHRKPKRQHKELKAAAHDCLFMLENPSNEIKKRLEFPVKIYAGKKFPDLSNNKLHGRILKSELGGRKSLAYLNLAQNFLTYIEHHPWRNIVTLDLSNNMLQGSLLVPPPKTDTFLLSNDQLTGLIPPSICNLSSLVFPSLSSNNLNGRIPQCFGSFGLIVMLHLQKNNLHGSLPDSFANLSSLRSLDLNGNKFEGRLARSSVNCSRLEVINVGNNNIRDEFPYWLGTPPELKVVVLRSNKFYGPIQYSKSLFHFSKLQILHLSHNEFKGFLPRKLFQSLAAMSHVAYLRPSILEIIITMIM
ncbi:receptor-like protein 7 [Mangifera indica]|uniref:receptor-like protein 7 n=1 Tax=Mangifera indica TaxID=29780 RepID=UPI001CFA6F96|nr:receptor-like protein 7 [Mangifera indica]